MELDPGSPLTPEQERLGEELTRLVEGPSPEATARIMAAVRAAPGPAVTSGRWRWRKRALAAAGGLALLGGSGVTALAASAHALPGSPAYTLRNLGEHLRLDLAGAADRERLRISFARDRLQQAAAAGAHGDSRVAAELLDDSRSYLRSAIADLPDLPPAERGDVQNELNSAGHQEQTTAGELRQEGVPVAPSPAPSHGARPQQPPPSPAGENGGGSSPQSPPEPRPSETPSPTDVPEPTPPPVPASPGDSGAGNAN